MLLLDFVQSRQSKNECLVLDFTVHLGPIRRSELSFIIKKQRLASHSVSNLGQIFLQKIAYITLLSPLESELEPKWAEILDLFR